MRVFLSRLSIFLFCLFLAGMVLAGQSKGKKPSKEIGNEMSPMGQAATRHIEIITNGGASGPDLVAPKQDDDNCVNEPRCAAGLREGPAGGQAELSIAVDSTGQNIVIGFNDTRGFSRNPISVSGYMVSHDGGTTFTDGGQLPSPEPHDTIGTGTTKYPQVFGDPDVKYLGGCTFVYSSIMVRTYTTTVGGVTRKGLAQTMSIHRSSDCGDSWQGPFEVTAATNPNGFIFVPSGNAVDAADKEFIDVDPETGRVIMSWTNFSHPSVVPPGGVQIMTAYSDNALSANPPTWSSARSVAQTAADGQASIPRFAGGGSPNAYLTWRRFPGGGTNSTGFARSTDNGATWSAPVDLSPPFFTVDQILGNDRVNTSPGLAVDRSSGPHRGSIYVVYANNNAEDGGDIVFQRSTDQGLTFSTPILLNARPGEDRSQWFPWVNVDSTTGTIYVFYYDQGVGLGDLSEVQYTFSQDGGNTWKQPLPLSDRPFQAGWGNDTGQPNLGDYNQAVAQGGELFAAWAGTMRPPLGFPDGQPSGNMTVPDAVFSRLREADHKFKASTVQIANVSVTDSGGNGHLDPAEEATVWITLKNYVTNPLNADKVRGINATLSTSTPGVTVASGVSSYPNLDPGQSGTNEEAFVLRLDSSFIAGTFIELSLNVKSAQHGEATLRHTVFTGTPVTTTLLAQNFDGVPPGTLPAGWVASHGARMSGSAIIPWTTSNSFCGTTSNAAFHQNADDGSGPGRHTRWERLFSPTVTVPPDAQYVTVEMDVCYNTEEEPAFNVQAYDGFFLRVTDLTTGRTVRSVLAEAFTDEFTTGPVPHYPKHFPRSSNPAYFEDMSAWAGLSNGFRHVRLRFPGMAGSTIQLRFEYTQDAFFNCEFLRPGSTCGVLIDNVVLNSVRSQ